jgi:hypothetical protein
MDKLLHPILLSNCELIAIIKDRQLSISNLEKLARDELLDIFKMHIMPKPQRQRSTQSSHSQDSSDSTSLAKEVKRIKLNREHSQPEYTHNSSIQRMETALSTRK